MLKKSPAAKVVPEEVVHTFVACELSNVQLKFEAERPVGLVPEYIVPVIVVLPDKAVSKARATVESLQP